VACPGCPKCSPNDGYVLSMSAGRCTKSHEYVFLLAKSESYYYDSESIKEPNANPDRTNYTSGSRINGVNNDRNDNDLGKRSKNFVPNGRNKRSVWNCNTTPFREAHFATFPPALIEPMVLAGTSDHGVCPKCGNQWVRIIERIPLPRNDKRTHSTETQRLGKTPCPEPTNGVVSPTVNTTGWRATCKCGLKPVPAIVLDPFMGAGTTGCVAKSNHRDFVGIELNEKYVTMANRRIDKVNGVLF